MNPLLYISRKMNLSQTKELIIKNLFWSLLGKTVNLLGGLLVGILVARYLGPEQYGLMNYVISFVFLFQTLALFGLDSIEIREESKQDVAYQQIIGTAFWLKMLFGAICILLSIGTSWIMADEPYTTALVAVYSITIVLNSFTVIRNYFTSIVQNEFVVKAEIVRTVIGICIKCSLLIFNAHLSWFVTAAMFDFVLLAGGYYVAYRTKIGRMSEWTFDWNYAKYLMKESFPLMLTNAAVIIYQRIDQVMIGQIIDTEAVGYFAVASRFVEVLVFIPIMLAQTITPILVRFREESEETYQAKGQQFMNISLWLSLLISAVVAISSYWLVRLTFGEMYLPAVAVLQIMSFKAASVALSNTAGAMLVTEHLQRYAIFRDSLGCVVCIGLNALLLPRFGIIAAAYIAIASNVAAGYLADAIIPAYRHLFIRQTKALFLGWKELVNIKQLFIQR
ncbi:MAG: flippase [Prevotella sp.]|nr:flippase [Prevotella sp.]